jgi:hypothetical protein
MERMMVDRTLTLVKSRQKRRSRLAWLWQFYQNFTQVTDEQVIATLVRFSPNVPTVKTNPGGINDSAHTWTECAKRQHA